MSETNSRVKLAYDPKATRESIAEIGEQIKTIQERNTELCLEQVALLTKKAKAAISFIATEVIIDKNGNVYAIVGGEKVPSYAMRGPLLESAALIILAASKL